MHYSAQQAVNAKHLFYSFILGQAFCTIKRQNISYTVLTEKERLGQFRQYLVYLIPSAEKTYESYLQCTEKTRVLDQIITRQYGIKVK